MNRRFGTPPDPARHYGPRPGVYAVILAGDGVLVTFQQQPRPEFQLPGGGVDPGEHPLPALHREVREETGYRIAVMRRLGMFHRFAYMPDYDRHAQKLCHVYLARAIYALGPPTEPGHTAHILPWRAAAQSLAVSGDRFFLRQAAEMLRL